jgi:hypothetical protein
VRIIVLTVIALASIGCKSEPPKPGEPVTFATVCTSKYDSKEEKGLSVTQRVTLEGYLGAPKMMFCSDTCSLRLYPTAERKDGDLSISLKVGTDPNQLEELPKEFSEQDIKVRTSDGKVVGVGAKIRVTGGRLGTQADKTCQLVSVDLIESA